MKAVCVVLTDPVAGTEDEFNDWYTKTHLADVTASPGFVAAQRFELVPSATAADPGGPQQQYCALYEVEAESVEEIETISAALVAGMTNGSVELSPALDMATVSCRFYLSISDRIEA